MLMQIDRLRADINSTKLRMVESDIKRKTEESTRAAIMNGRRIRTKYATLRFIGEPKVFKDIASAADMIFEDPQRADLILMLEDMSVYGNSSGYSLDRLRPLV